MAQICASFGVGGTLPAFGPIFNAAPETSCPIIVKDRLGMALWGWPVGESDKPLINIRSETAAEKPSFKNAWLNDRRCLVPACGFYEWDSSGQPFFVEAPDSPSLAFCGLWTRGYDGGVHFAILTCAAIPALAPIHPRMPWVATPKSAAAWLNKATFPSILPLRAYPVSRAVNTIANNSPALLDPLPQAAQGNLFMAG